MRLTKEDWNQLDELLGKHGFGGYYDLVECLKMSLNSLGFSNTGIDIDDIKTLPDVVSALNYWTNAISNDNEFINLLERVLYENKKD